MNKKNKIILILLVLLASSIQHPVSSSGVGTTAANFLKLPQDVRSASMGDSFVADAKGPSALYWNPAGLANGVFNEGRMVYNKWVQGVFCGYAAYRQNFKTGGLGLAVTYLNSGEMAKRGNGREDSGTSYCMEDISVDIGHGLSISDYFNAGISVKYIYESIDTDSISGAAFGLGAQYHRRIKEHYLSVGMSVMNIGARLGYEDKFPLPAVVRFGVGDELLTGRLKGSAEVDYYYVENKINGGVGVEICVAPFIDFRCGYRFGYRDLPAPYGLTAGLGIKYIERVEYLFDYSVSTLGDLGYINRIGFGVKF